MSTCCPFVHAKTMLSDSARTLLRLRPAINRKDLHVSLHTSKGLVNSLLLMRARGEQVVGAP